MAAVAVIYVSCFSAAAYNFCTVRLKLSVWLSGDESAQILYIEIRSSARRLSTLQNFTGTVLLVLLLLSQSTYRELDAGLPECSEKAGWGIASSQTWLRCRTAPR